jgi:hypothetical protein
MKNRHQKILFVLIALFACTSLYALEHRLVPGAYMEFVLAPNQRQEYPNFAFQTIHARCRISTEDKQGNDIFVEIVRKSGKINDVPVTAGDNLMIHVFNNEVLLITAEPGGKVALTNKGLHEIRAACST